MSSPGEEARFMASFKDPVSTPPVQQGGPPHALPSAPAPTVKPGLQIQQATVPSKGAAEQPGVAVSASGGTASQRQKQWEDLWPETEYEAKQGTDAMSY